MTLDLGNARQLATRWSAGKAEHDRRFGTEQVEDSLATGYGESTIAYRTTGRSYVGAVGRQNLQSARAWSSERAGVSR